MAFPGQVLEVEWKVSQSAAWRTFRGGMTLTLIGIVLAAGLTVLIADPTTVGQWSFGLTFAALGFALPILAVAVDRHLKRNEPIALRFTPDGVVVTYQGEVIEKAAWRDVDYFEFRPSPKGTTGQLLMKIRQRRHGWERTLPMDTLRTIVDWHRAADAR